MAPRYRPPSTRTTSISLALLFALSLLSPTIHAYKDPGKTLEHEWHYLGTPDLPKPEPEKDGDTGILKLVTWKMIDPSQDTRVMFASVWKACIAGDKAECSKKVVNEFKRDTLVGDEEFVKTVAELIEHPFTEEALEKHSLLFKKPPQGGEKRSGKIWLSALAAVACG